MMRSILFVCAAAVALLAPRLAAQTIQLADGKLILAVVEDQPDGDGLRVRRLDNGGLLELRWDQLAPAAALALKRKYDLAGETQDEVLVHADEVTYDVRGQKQSVIGKVTNYGIDSITVTQRGVQYTIKRTDLGPVRQIDVPVAQVYTKDEWYGIKLTDLKDAGSADQHIVLAEDLIKVRDYDHAAEHLKTARELGNSRDPQRLDNLSQKLARYKDNAKERELLDDIQACRSRGNLVEFEKGRKLIAQYLKDFPTTRLKTEFDNEKTAFEAARTRFLTRQVADTFRRGIQSLADKKVGEGVTLDAARKYAESNMTDELFERTAQQLRLELEETKTLWAGRGGFTEAKRTEHFAYNLGSWILGKGVTKGTDAEKGKGNQEAADGGNAREIDKLARAMKQALERRRAATQGQGQAQQEQTEEEWWQDATRAEKNGWLRAYYAEFGGQLQVTFATVSPCVSCYGRGVNVEMGPDGKPIQVPCFLCHGTKWMRSIKAY